MIDEEYSTISPPYISFRTFLNLIERLAEGGIPQHIDRSYWKPFLSGSLGPHVMTTLRFFGLITSAQNEPTPELARLVEDREHRKQIFAALLRKLYAPVFNDVDLARGTSGHLERTFTRYYKMSPDTRRKSITFFLHAAQYADLPLSAYLKDTSRARGADAKSLNRTQPTKQASAPLAHAVMASRQSRQAASDPSSMLITRSAKTVALRSGGEISLTCSVDWIGMDRADRTFVFDLIDQLKDYELAAVIDDLAGAGMDGEREEGLAEEAL
jgi:Family of unknown function (DUF5343)